MNTLLPQKYQQVAKAIVPYQTRKSSQQLGFINIEPALPCVLCGSPATEAIIAPAPDQAPGSWLTFPVCSACEERQVFTESNDQSDKAG
jgi:hypothetical protein